MKVDKKAGCVMRGSGAFLGLLFIQIMDAFGTARTNYNLRVFLYLARFSS